jgi:predicted Zn-dependent protease
MIKTDLESTFDRLVTAIRAELKPDEQFTLELSGEQSQFIRFNAAKVRQTGYVTDADLQLTLMQNQRSSFRDFSMTGNWETDWQQAQLAIADLRQEIPQLPSDPYLVLPSGHATSRDVYSGTILPPDAAVAEILPEVQGLDFTGIYAGGTSIRLLRMGKP